jgi:hypothetical protein
MMFGALDKPENQNLSDMDRREIAYMVPLIVFMFWIGLYPKPFIRVMEPAVANIVQKVNPGMDQRNKLAREQAGRMMEQAERGLHAASLQSTDPERFIHQGE